MDSQKILIAGAPLEKKTYKLIPPLPLTNEQLGKPMSKEGIVFWGVHRNFGPWCILPRYLNIDHIIKFTGNKSLIDGKPVQVENKRTGMRHYIVRRCDLKETLLKASRMFTMNPTVLLKVIVALQPASFPMTFKFDRRKVAESLKKTHLKEKELLLRLFSGTQKLDKVMHNIRTYSLHRPDEDGLFMQWIAPLLQLSIVEVDMY